MIALPTMELQYINMTEAYWEDNINITNTVFEIYFDNCYLETVMRFTQDYNEP
ncbi:hypothetical protein [Paenibacillus polymyxa]|uniref:hypothetical protein n=1 Tax=Paenibacillus polymyxa TaxID=1406 RepID=UPI002ED1A534